MSRQAASVLELDFFTDPELIREPTHYYAALREHGSVMREPHHGVFMLSGIEEIKGPFRLALRDTRIAGVDIPMGSIVLAMNGAANRDPRVFEDPDRFDAKRSNARRNIAFGHGEHFCPGASLARTEARIRIERLLARLDDLQLVDPDALSYVPSFIIRGLQDLPLRFGRRA